MGVSLRQLDVLARRHATAVQQVEAHRQARDEAIVALLDAGHTTDVVAEHAHVTQPRVVQIAKRVREHVTAGDAMVTSLLAPLTREGTMVKERVRPDGSTYLSGRDVELEQARLQRKHVTVSPANEREGTMSETPEAERPHDYESPRDEVYPTEPCAVCGLRLSAGVHWSK